MIAAAPQSLAAPAVRARVPALGDPAAVGVHLLGRADAAQPALRAAGDAAAHTRYM